MPRSLRWRDLVPGALIVVAIALATAATLKYGRIGRLAGETVRFYAAFRSARTVMGGTEVWVNGRKVGRVNAIRFAPAVSDTARRVVLELEVLERYRDQIRQNSLASLRNGARVMGSRVVYISAGTGDAPMVAANDTIPSTSGGDIQVMTATLGEAGRELPAIMANVKVVSASLSSARGTIGALTASDGPGQVAALLENTSRLTARATRGTGTLGLAMRRGEIIARAKSASAQADSLRALLASDRTSFGRFRRDSTLLRAVGQVRDELSITRRLLASQTGTLGRFGSDSIIAVQTAERERLMTELFADLKRRPFRYIAF